MRHQTSVGWDHVGARANPKGGDLYSYALERAGLGDQRPYGRCSCGWRGDSRRRWIYAVGDAADHKVESSPPQRRTRHGLQLRFERGCWVTMDGRWAIGPVRELTTCEGVPHPYNLIDGDTGRRVQYYCDGSHEHDHECGFDIRPANGTGGGDSDMFYTLDEAWRELAKWTEHGRP